MELSANARLRIKKDVVIRVQRRLGGGAGSISAMLGQELKPEDILGISKVSAGFRTIHLAKELGVSSQEAPQFLKRQLGQSIYQGELLAQKEGTFGLSKKVLLSPSDGVLDFYDPKQGELRIKLLPHNRKLVSGVFGVVEQINIETGTVVIRTLATVIYGVLGSGKERDGNLRFLGSKELLVSSKQLNAPLKGEIVVGGAIVFLDAFHKAIEQGISGIISGGVNAGDYKAMVGGDWNLSFKRWSDVGFSLMVTEGFGSIPIGDDIFEVMKSYEGKYVSLDGNRSRLILPSQDQNSIMYIRKVSLPSRSFIESEPEIGEIEIKPGQKVRIVYPTWLGKQGVVEVIDKSPTHLPSGVVTFLITVTTRSQKLRVPYHNVEIIP